MKTVTIRYFAILRDQRGLTLETRTTGAPTYQDLYSELDLTLSASLVRVAVNSAFKEMTDSIEDGAEIVFIPPVAGG